MNLDCISQLLINGGAATALGVDLFQFHMPEDCEQGILLKLPIQGIPINHYIPGFFKARFQAIVRSPTHTFGDPLALLVSKLLTVSNVFFPGSSPAFIIKQMFPTTLPVVYPRSAGNIYEWSINLECCYLMRVAETAPGDSFVPVVVS